MRNTLYLIALCLIGWILSLFIYASGAFDFLIGFALIAFITGIFRRGEI